MEQGSEQGRGTYRFLYSREKPPPCCMQLANQYDLGRVHFVEKKTSGKVSWRERKIAEVLESLKANDAIVVSELSMHNPRCERLFPR